MAQRAHIEMTVGGTAIGALRSATFSSSLSMLEAAAETAYGAVRRVAGVFSWQAGGSVFLPAGGDAGQIALRDAILGLSTVAVVVTFADGSTETGTAVVTSWEVEGSTGDAVTGSFSLRGTGALTAG